MIEKTLSPAAHSKRYANDRPRFWPIGDYAAIGDGLTAALVAKDGSIDWCCFPRFDSPSVFARILDADRGGHWHIAPRVPFSTSRAYEEDTNVLVTVFETESGEVELVDFMPAQSALFERIGDSAIIRIVRGRTGRVACQNIFSPQFNYARDPCVWDLRDGTGVRATTDHGTLTMYAAARTTVDARGACSTFEVGHGETVAFVLLFKASDRTAWHTNLPGHAAAALHDTIRLWRSWIARCTYRGRHEAAVRRSALVLKLLDYAPTGAIVAAPTTSLPERIGGVRNWDYRFSWLRDTAFTVHALYKLGFRQESELFLDWILELAENDPVPVQVLYTVDGGRSAREQCLDHLEGYRGSRPVRIGNAAYRQRQLDVYGEVLDCAFLLHKFGGIIPNSAWAFLRRIVDHVCEVWVQPDHGIWEVRGAPQHFVYSKALCWIAVDRGIRIAAEAGLQSDRTRWLAIRDRIMADILTKGYSTEAGAFTQTYGSSLLDASILAMALRNVLPAHEPRMRSSVEQVASRLTDRGFVRRYDQRTNDGLPEGEGAFLACSFWLADCYAEMGEIAKAEALFERLLVSGNDLGLYSEEIDPATGELLGNVPQAFTHVALINAAVTLARAGPS